MVELYFRNRIRYDMIVSAFVVVIHVLSSITNGNVFLKLSGDDLKIFSVTIFSVAISLLGFVLAAGTFLIAHAQNEAFSILRRSSSFAELIRLISSSIWRLVYLSICTILLFIAGSYIEAWLLAFTIFLTVFASLALGALTHIILKMLAVPLHN